MKSTEAETHAFIIRLWREQREIKNARPIWRGTIEHVPSGKRKAFAELEEILDFIALHLSDVDVKVNICWQLRRWLKTKLLQRHNRG